MSPTELSDWVGLQVEHDDYTHDSEDQVPCRHLMPPDKDARAGYRVVVIFFGKRKKLFGFLPLPGHYPELHYWFDDLPGAVMLVEAWLARSPVAFYEELRAGAFADARL